MIGSLLREMLKWKPEERKTAQELLQNALVRLSDEDEEDIQDAGSENTQSQNEESNPA